jgi:hypothetical protein
LNSDDPVESISWVWSSAVIGIYLGGLSRNVTACLCLESCRKQFHNVFRLVTRSGNHPSISSGSISYSSSSHSSIDEWVFRALFGRSIAENICKVSTNHSWSMVFCNFVRILKNSYQV